MPTYELWDLGPCSYDPYPSLNDRDTATLGAESGQGMVWSKGVTYAIDQPGYVSSSPFAINNGDDVVGIVGAEFAPFTWNHHDGKIDLSGAFESESGSAQDINSERYIVGCSNFNTPGTPEGPLGVAVPPIFPCIYHYDSRKLTDLRPVVGDSQGLATRINDLGQVVGFNAAGSFFYRDGATTDISHGLNVGDIFPTDINNSGQILMQLAYGAAIHDVASGVLTFLQSPTAVQPLGINDAGVAVGMGNRGDESSYAWIYPAIDGKNDLNDLIDPNLGWNLELASDINTAGHVVGIARTASHERRAFILTEPNALLIPPSSKPYFVFLDQILYGVVQDGGGRTRRHGPIPPRGEKIERELGKGDRADELHRIVGELGDLAKRAKRILREGGDAE